MTKFSISASRSQAQAAAKACSNLKSDVNQLMNKVNSFGAENFEGAAADNAQRYAEAVIMPLLRGASALFDDIPIAMKRLPGEYEGKVDHKSWSTEKLKAKIKQYETAAKKAQKAADAANKLAQKASGMGTVGAGIMAAASKCAAGFEKGMASAQKAIAKFKKILDDFDRFDIFSPTIFNEIATLESNLNKGQKVANGAYNPSSHQFSIPKESELNWAKELNGTYAEHEEKLSKKSESFPKIKINGVWNFVVKTIKNGLLTAWDSLNEDGKKTVIGGAMLGTAWSIGNLSEGIKSCIVKYNSHNGYYDINKIIRGMKLSNKLDSISAQMKELGNALVPDVSDAVNSIKNMKNATTLSDSLKGMGTTIKSLFDGLMSSEDIREFAPELGRKVFFIGAAIDIADELKDNDIPDAVVKGTCHAGIETITGTLDIASNVIHIPEKGLGGLLNSNISSAADEKFDAMYDKHKKSIHKAMQNMGKATLSPQSQL